MPGSTDRLTTDSRPPAPDAPIPDTLTVASNRLPVRLEHTASGWRVRASSGGLAQAMSAVLGRRGGNWVGWPGEVSTAHDWRAPFEAFADTHGYDLEPVMLERDDVDGYYTGFANSVLWPLFHGFTGHCNFEAAFWQAYLEVNRKFALRLARSPRTGPQVWVHDYHLIHTGKMLRTIKPSVERLGFFLHIPFPEPDTLRRMPWSSRVLDALLAYDLIGFQTAQDLHNFASCVESIAPDLRVRRRGARVQIELGRRHVDAEVFPIGTDFDEFSGRARSPEAAAEAASLQASFDGCKVILGVDRLDYSKGLLNRLRAYEDLLERCPHWRERVVLHQLVVPSRESVPAYASLKRQVDRAVGRIVGRFSTRRWSPIRYRYNRVDPVELAAMYRQADAALVTPLRDGMNLVAKEYIACQVDDPGVLVLSEFAGAADQLADGAILVNPYDVHASARAIRAALEMPVDQRAGRMDALRQVVRSTDVHWWAERFTARLAQPSPADHAVEPIWHAPADHALPLRAL